MTQPCLLQLGHSMFHGYNICRSTQSKVNTEELFHYNYPGVSLGGRNVSCALCNKTTVKAWPYNGLNT